MAQLRATDGWRIILFQTTPTSHAYISGTVGSTLQPYVISFLTQEMISSANEILEASLKFKAESSLHGDQFLSDKAKDMRWFLLPWEAQAYLSPSTIFTPHTPPFKPRDFRKHGSQSSAKPTAAVVTTPVESLSEKIVQNCSVGFHSPPKIIFKPTTEVSQY